MLGFQRVAYEIHFETPRHILTAMRPDFALRAERVTNFTFLISCQAVFMYTDVSCNLHGIRSMPKRKRKTRSMAAAKSSKTKKAKRKTAKKKGGKKKK